MFASSIFRLAAPDGHSMPEALMQDLLSPGESPPHPKKLPHHTRTIRTRRARDDGQQLIAARSDFSDYTECVVNAFVLLESSNRQLTATEERIMDEFAHLQSTVSAALVATTRTSSQLAAQDLPFHRSLDFSVAVSLDRQNARLLSLTERLLSSAAPNTATTKFHRFQEVESIDTNWRAVIDVVDSLLERADTALDEFTGAVRRLTPDVDQQTHTNIAPRRNAVLFRNQDLEKPLLLFEEIPNNHPQGSFRPLLISKPHALVPLSADLAADGHPYQAEIEAYEYPNSMYCHSEPIPFHSFETTTATMVDTEDKVQEMLTELKRAKEIAIDLEHHDQRSYIGIVSLMQISTRDRDWIVDTLKPWRRKLQCLNEVFADPKVIKVLHGAHMDAIWLQRDLGLYLVGLFDTHHASRSLGYPAGSLAYLLKRFVDVDAQKQYQTADWRVRPLPQELFDYARSDTHYLLYIFDCMRNELIEKSDFAKANHEGDKIWDVLVKSSETALQRYENPVYDTELGEGPVGWYRLLARTSLLLTKQQFSVFRAVHKWRDDVAREQDDSPHYVMPNHQIFGISKVMPSTRAELLNVAQPLTRTVRLRADELLAVVVRAKEDGETGPDMMETLNRVEPQFPRKPVKESVSLPALTLRSDAITPIHSSTLPLRAPKSAFWGPAFDSSRHHLQPVFAPPFSLTIPLPPLEDHIIVEIPNTDSNTAPPSAEQTSPRMDGTDTFTLNDRSKKRKRVDTQPLDGMAANSDEVAIPDEAIDDAAERAQRQNEKAEARRAKKSAKKAQAIQQISEKPYDYNSAPSLLNPVTETREQMRDRRKKEKNPYAKAMDAPHGLPRAQKERAGRSMTFK